MSYCVPISKHKRCKQRCKRQFSATSPRAPPNRIGKLKANRKPTGHFHCEGNEDWSLDISSVFQFGRLVRVKLNAVSHVFIHMLIAFPMVRYVSFFLDQLAPSLVHSETCLYICIIYIYTASSTLMGESSHLWLETLADNTWHALEPPSPIREAISCEARCRLGPWGLLFDATGRWISVSLG